MILSTEIEPYLSGQRFSNALKIAYSERFPERSRTDLIVKLCKDKRVLHIGCADHIPLIKSKIKQKKWLHGLLTDVATECAGIDIHKEAIQYLQDEIGVKNVYHADITNGLPEKLRNTNWDIVVMGEILEHVDNPVLFLQQIKHQLSSHAKQLLITVPNSFNHLMIKDIQIKVEDINSDHRYNFTPYTLSKVLYSSGFEKVEFEFTDRIALPLHLKILNRLCRIAGIHNRFSIPYFATMVALTNFNR